MTDDLIRSWPDHEQIIKGIGDIKAELLASSTIHFTTSPFQSMSQTNSSHHFAIPLPQICLLVFGILWRPGDIISLIHYGYTGQICLRNSSNCQEVVQGVYACRWRQCWALFDIHVDFKLVNVKLIFVLYQKSDLISCLKSCFLYYKNQ